jgi:OmpA-OmpF porin, OOP family
MSKLARAIFVAASIAPITALAQQPMQHPWYIGAGVGRGHADISNGDFDGANTNNDGNDTAYTVRAGWKFSPYVAAELGYFDFGKYGFHTNGTNAINVSSRVQSLGLSLVGTMPINAFDLYGRLGVARTETKSTISTSGILIGSGDSASGKERQNEAIYGVGARWNAARQWGVFAEWMKNDKIDLNTYLIGVDFKF